MGYGLLSPEEQAKLTMAQRKKKNDLNNYVNQANEVINEINEINNKIDKANACVSQMRQIPGIINEPCATMGSVGSALQSGLTINGEPVGINVSNDSISMIGNIENGVNDIVSKIQEYCNKKNIEGNEKKQQVEQIRNQYQKRLASYPADLGPYAPAPTFPNVPEIKNFGG